MGERGGSGHRGDPRTGKPFFFLLQPPKHTIPPPEQNIENTNVLNRQNGQFYRQDANCNRHNRKATAKTDTRDFTIANTANSTAKLFSSVSEFPTGVA